MSPVAYDTLRRWRALAEIQIGRCGCPLGGRQGRDQHAESTKHDDDRCAKDDPAGFRVKAAPINVV